MQRYEGFSFPAVLLLVLHCCFKRCRNAFWGNENESIRFQEFLSHFKFLPHTRQRSQQIPLDVVRLWRTTTKTTVIAPFILFNSHGKNHFHECVLTRTSSHWNIKTVVVCFPLGRTDTVSRDLNTPESSTAWRSRMSLKAMDSSSSWGNRAGFYTHSPGRTSLHRIFKVRLMIVSVGATVIYRITKTKVCICPVFQHHEAPMLLSFRYYMLIIERIKLFIFLFSHPKLLLDILHKEENVKVNTFWLSMAKVSNEKKEQCSLKFSPKMVKPIS